MIELFPSIIASSGARQSRASIVVLLPKESETQALLAQCSASLRSRPFLHGPSWLPKFQPSLGLKSAVTSANIPSARMWFHGQTLLQEGLGNVVFYFGSHVCS